LDNSSLVRRLHGASAACGVWGALIGLTALAGSFTGRTLLEGGIPPNTAVCLVLVGVAVVLVGWDRRSALRQWLGAACALLVLGVSGAALAQHLLGVKLGADQVLLRVFAAGDQEPAQTGAVAASGLSLLALALLATDKRSGDQRSPLQPLTVVVLIVTSVSLLGYLFDVEQLFSISRYTGIALPTAAALWLLALGILLARPEAGFMHRFVDDDSGALMMRRLLPAALLVPIVVMVVHAYAEERGLFDRAVARAILVVAFMVIFAALIWRTGEVVSRQAARAARAERTLSERLAHSLESITDGFIGCDFQWRITYINAATEQTYGKHRDHVVGQTLWAFIPEIVGTAVEEQYRAAMDQRVAVTFETTSDQGERIFEHKVFPTPDGGLATYERDVTEERRAISVLEHADRRKTEFLATLAHELRNPLAPVRSAVHVLRSGRGSDADTERAYAVIDRQVDHLTRLIDDLLDVSRISRDELALQTSSVVLSDIISGAVDASRHILDARGHRLSVTLPSDDLYLEADAVRLVQVFTNLLTNAGRYTPEGGSISVTAEREGGDLVIEVADNGIGIAAEQMPRLFDMFFQAERGNRRGHGLGIGLALVQKIVALHGGSVIAQSAGTGQGSTFIIRLPLSHPAAVAATPIPTSRVIPSVSGLRVLVVDDNRDSAEMLSVFLEHGGARVHVAGDGQTALALGAETNPEVVLLDIGLPDMSGHDVAREIRGATWGAHTFIVAVSGWGQANDHAHSEDAGFDRHLVKPVDPDELLSLLAERWRTPAATARSSA
jgi:PAS domain S-box-containing protein